MCPSFTCDIAIRVVGSGQTDLPFIADEVRQSLAPLPDRSRAGQAVQSAAPGNPPQIANSARR